MKYFICFVLFVTLFLSAQTVDDILDKVEANEDFKTSRSESTEIIYTSGGDKRISKMKGYAANGNEKGLNEYVSPKRIKGMKILMLNDGDDIWFYSNRTNRVRKIASHQKKRSANGSDFSYEDMSLSDSRNDYNYKLAGEKKVAGKDCYIVEFTAKEEDQTYSRMLNYIDKERLLVLAIDFYDEDGSLWKQLSVNGIEKKGKYWTAAEVVMKNIIRDSKTIIKTDKIEFDIEIDESLFSERALKK